MSGYRAAPEGVKVTAPMPGGYVVTLRRESSANANEYNGNWVDELTGDVYFDEWEADAFIDALYYARLTALDSAAAACEAIGDARGAEAVRRLKETT